MTDQRGVSGVQRWAFGAAGAATAACPITRSYVDGTSGRTVYVHHAQVSRLQPGHDYIYAVQHDGAGTRCRHVSHRARRPGAVHLTSFGHQSVPQVTWAADATVGLAALSAPASFDIVAGVERVAPLFHLLNGALCYADLDLDLDLDRIGTWNGFFANNTRSMRFRMSMPAAGNHAIERLNGPVGCGAYQTYFDLPGRQSDPEVAGLWYAFAVGSVRVIVLENDDSCLQDAGDVYVNGYSGGAQVVFLERELATARASRDTDWIVAAMHHVMISSADGNGSDLALRHGAVTPSPQTNSFFQTTAARSSPPCPRNPAPLNRRT